MTPTTSEREARDALEAAAEEIEAGHAWISREAASVIIRKHAAALTRQEAHEWFHAADEADEQQEGEQECPNCVSPWKCNGPHIGEAPKHGYGDDDEPQQEAQGAVACNGKLVGWWNGIMPDVTGRSLQEPSVRWGADAENSGHDIPLYDGYNPIHYTTPPAPVDVREVVAQMRKWVTNKDNAQPVTIARWLALLDGQPAGVDAEVIRDSWRYRYLRPFTVWWQTPTGSGYWGDDLDAAVDAAIARDPARTAALQAALGGGGGR